MWALVTTISKICNGHLGHCHLPKAQANSLLACMRDQLLSQLVSLHTRIGSILDLILSNQSHTIPDIEYEVNHSLSDHYTIIVTSTIYPGKLTRKPISKDYYTTDLYKYDM